MRSVVTSPHNDIWFLFLRPAGDILEGSLSHDDWCVTVRVTELLGNVFWSFRETVTGSTADWFATISIGANLILEV